MKKKIPDTEFIQGKRTEAFSSEIINGSTYAHSFEITKGNETRKYSPYDFLDLVLECHYVFADSTEDQNEKRKAFLNARQAITGYIREHKLGNLGYDFSELFLSIDNALQNLKENAVPDKSNKSNVHETINKKKKSKAAKLTSQAIAVICFFEQIDYPATDEEARGLLKKYNPSHEVNTSAINDVRVFHNKFRNLNDFLNDLDNGQKRAARIKAFTTAIPYLLDDTKNQAAKDSLKLIRDKIAANSKK